MQPFKRRALVLFLTISLFPALTVSALWYVFTRDTAADTFLSFGKFAAPVAVLGLLPALVLAFVFAELLATPIKEINLMITNIKKGNFKVKSGFKPGTEFAEMASGLEAIASKQESILSQKEGETELITAERNKLRAVLDSMEDGVFAIDGANRVILFNKAAAAITGRSIADVAGQLSEKVLPFRRHGELVMAKWLATGRGGGEQISQWKDMELYRADGESVFVDVRALLLDSDPNGIKALVTFHDKTKSHQLEEMRVDFVALAAHELRTPLTAIRGYLDLLNLEIYNKLDPVQKSIIRRSIISANQLSGLVNNLLNVSRIEHGELSLKLEPVSWHDLIVDLSPDLLGRAKEQNRNLAIKMPKSLPRVAIDSVALREVINNLVDNAINYTKPGGDIELSVKRVGNEVITTVADNGPGIPKEALPKLFNKFYRVHGIHTTRGTGLGLYISKALVEAHKGYIWVESVLDQGSTFGFNLPVYKAVAPKVKPGDNATRQIIRGTHGWIKR